MTVTSTRDRALLERLLRGRLFETADEVVLNVGQANAPGLRAYARVGFGAAGPESRVPYLEGAGVSLRQGAAALRAARAALPFMTIRTIRATLPRTSGTPMSGR